jgi:hypothetical protein
MDVISRAVLAILTVLAVPRIIIIIIMSRGKSNKSNVLFGPRFDSDLLQRLDPRGNSRWTDSDMSPPPCPKMRGLAQSVNSAGGGLEAS